MGVILCKGWISPTGNDDFGPVSREGRCGHQSHFRYMDMLERGGMGLIERFVNFFEFRQILMLTTGL